MNTLKSVLLLALFTIGLISCGGDNSGSDGGNCANKTATTSVTQMDATPKVAADTGCSLQSATPNPVVGTTVHDNEMVLSPSFEDPDVKPVAFEWDQAYSITPGQPWEGLIAKIGSGSIIVKAGRKGSNTPQDWFKVRNGGARISNQGWGNIDSLNFAFTGHLVINDDRYLVVIGQEGFAGTNGWWIAGQGSGWTFHSRIVGDNYILTPDKKWEIKGAQPYAGFQVIRH
jgi:hypothetical protein